jgi:GTPase SAR1 family protein
MADQHPPQIAKSKRFLSSFKKVFGLKSQRPAGSSNSPPIDPKEAAKLRAKYTHFRILVIGRANAGKTTLLQRVCNTKEDPVYTKVRYQFRLNNTTTLIVLHRQINPTSKVPSLHISHDQVVNSSAVARDP